MSRQSTRRPSLWHPKGLPNYDDVCDLIVDTRAYIDTVKLWANWPLGADQFRLISANCHGKSWVDYEYMPYHPKWRCKLNMQRPNDVAFEFLDDLIGITGKNIVHNDIIINRVDFSIDWITKSPQDAEQVFEWVIFHFIKRWHGKQRAEIFKGTYYSNLFRESKNTENLVCAYCYRLSKTDDESPCCHFEWRCRSSRAASA